MKMIISTIPRRSRSDLWTAPEKAIHDAVQAIEKSPIADVRMTNAQNLLHQAQNLVADVIEERGAHTAINVSVVFLAQEHSFLYGGERLVKDAAAVVLNSDDYYGKKYTIDDCTVFIQRKDEKHLSNVADTNRTLYSYNLQEGDVFVVITPAGHGG
jgi:hypothetical protein